MDTMQVISITNTTYNINKLGIKGRDYVGVAMEILDKERLTRQKPDKTKLYFSVNAMFYDDCEEETKVPKPSIKSALSSLKDKGFINHYKDKEDKCVKGCYVANPKYIYSGTSEDYVNDCFELQTKGILVLI